MANTKANVDADELALSRAVIYRLLSLVCSYPTPAVCDGLRAVAPSARVAGAVLGRRFARAVDELRGALGRLTNAELERAYLSVFSATTSPTCPSHETAYTAKHLFQVSEQMADVAGFYRAFGVEPHGNRPDELAMELEFAYFLALKEAYAREHHGRREVLVCRAAQRAFMHDHLGRWGHGVASRMIAEAESGGALAAAGALLIVFLTWERRYLRVGESAPLPAQPYRPAEAVGDEPPCLAGQLAGDGDDRP